METATEARNVLIVGCQDRIGIVAAVTKLLVEQDCSIRESSHCHEDGRFFLRLVFAADTGKVLPPLGVLRERFAPVAQQFGMDWKMHDLSERPRTLIAVSKFGHCLYDLLHRWRSGLLPIEVVGVISNHDDMRSFVEWSGLPYFHLPSADGGKEAQEQKILDLISGLEVDLLVLARYMQILSPRLCQTLAGRCINIHHSFLPSFKGAKPYHQAHARGVKMIGATAHYVTVDLDEGPIIEQGVQRVNHSYNAAQLVEAGRDVECSVLARAVKWHVEHRVIVNGPKTIVFE